MSCQQLYKSLSYINGGLWRKGLLGCRGVCSFDAMCGHGKELEQYNNIKNNNNTLSRSSIDLMDMIKSGHLAGSLENLKHTLCIRVHNFPKLCSEFGCQLFIDRNTWKKERKKELNSASWIHC